MAGLGMAVHGWAVHDWAWLGWVWLGMAGLVCSISIPSFPFRFPSSTDVLVSGLWGENGFASIMNDLTIVVVQLDEADC